MQYEVAMFTGLIQTTAKVLSAERLGQESRLRLGPLKPFADLVKGESIAINGVCLTVEAYSSDSFTAYASAETMSCSNLKNLRTHSQVNLERALALGDRLGGHLVSGHVDCLATVAEVKPAGQSKIYRLHFPQEWSIYVVSKGSVALDGISLTVNECGDGFLEVNIIPATQQETNMSSWSPGTEVNMEIDMIAKYVRQMLVPFGAGDQRPRGRDLSLDFLRDHGFE